jgi:hypothetical protein
LNRRGFCHTESVKTRVLVYSPVNRALLAIDLGVAFTSPASL